MEDKSEWLYVTKVVLLNDLISVVVILSSWRGNCGCYWMRAANTYCSFQAAATILLLCNMLLYFPSLSPPFHHNVQHKVSLKHLVKAHSYICTLMMALCSLMKKIECVSILLLLLRTAVHLHKKDLRFTQRGSTAPGRIVSQRNIYMSFIEGIWFTWHYFCMF